MTSTDFSYPQPTDDELAAQQPRNPGDNVPPIYSSPGAGFDQYEHVPHQVGPHAADANSGASSGSVGGARTAGTMDTAGSSATGAVNSPTLGKTAMALSIIAGALSLVASAILGATIGPSEAASGYYFSDIPDWYQTLAAVLVGLQALCTGLGVLGIVLGIVSAVTARGRTFGIVAIAAALIAPFVSFGTFVALSFTFA